METTHEQWRPIRGYEGIYEVSNQGRVKSLKRVVAHKTTKTKTIHERILSPVIMNRGYAQVTLWENHRGKNKLVHTLVAEAFLGNRPAKQEVCHNNGIRNDNRLNNLRYGTRSENAKDRNIHGTNHLKNRTHCPRGHELAEPNLVKSAKNQGHRKCLACAKAHSYMHYHQKPKSELKRISDEYLKKIISANQHH